ncbi:hypothetical protein [Phenylobacterium sp.]|uniref:hypothetical protein n=1 Tax=Phenylobacterium sp. TaxID=1871053 RepID=UPI002720F7AB|nr:hypothetical protein [Phenylobacterium sp.]MDO8381022.1 hypothetical protein [Phenylobacterium sp.]
MTTAIHTELVMSALATAAQVAMSHHGQKHERAMFELRAGALTEITDALITRRVDAVKDGFKLVLDEYAAQARHFMTQQARFSDAQLGASDPLLRIELNQRIKDIDMELGRIRTDAHLLYAQMTEVILLIGGVDLGFGADLAGPLALPPARMRADL